MGAGSGYARLAVIAAVVAVVGSFVNAAAHAAGPSIGYVKSVAGASSIVRSGDRSNAAAGQPLFEKDVLETGGNGALGVTLKDNTLLSLGPNSSLTLETYLLRPDQENYSLVTRITRGTIQYVSGLIAKLSPDSVEIKTPAATLGVHGTRLLIKVDADAD